MASGPASMAAGASFELPGLGLVEEATSAVPEPWTMDVDADPEPEPVTREFLVPAEEEEEVGPLQQPLPQASDPVFMAPVPSMAGTDIDEGPSEENPQRAWTPRSTVVQMAEGDFLGPSEVPAGSVPSGPLHRSDDWVPADLQAAWTNEWFEMQEDMGRFRDETLFNPAIWSLPRQSVGPSGRALPLWTLRMASQHVTSVVNVLERADHQMWEEQWNAHMASIGSSLLAMSAALRGYSSCGGPLFQEDGAPSFPTETRIPVPKGALRLLPGPLSRARPLRQPTGPWMLPPPSGSLSRTLTGSFGLIGALTWSTTSSRPLPATTAPPCTVRSPSPHQCRSLRPRGRSLRSLSPWTSPPPGALT